MGTLESPRAQENPYGVPRARVSQDPLMGDPSSPDSPKVGVVSDRMVTIGMVISGMVTIVHGHYSTWSVNTKVCMS